MLISYYTPVNNNKEFCYYVEMKQTPSVEELNVLATLIGSFNKASTLKGSVYEVGPKLNYCSPWCSNAMAILQKCGITNITRIEKFYRSTGALPYDKMIQDIRYYESAQMHITSFAVNREVDPVQNVSNIEQFSNNHQLGFDPYDLQYYDKLFLELGRQPTDVELYDLAQSNSEHSRHWQFNGQLVIDDKPLDQTLFQMVKGTLPKNNNSVIAFKDNASAINGFRTKWFQPSNGVYVEKEERSHFTLTAETHNFPTGIAPFPGAATGTGGRIRDTVAIGCGGFIQAGTAGYCVGDINNQEPYDLHRPEDILIEASNGASDYGNKIGEPLVTGFCRSFGQKVDGQQREWIKPIMFSGGLGQMFNRNKIKQPPQEGWHIVRVGGPAYRIGMNGGAASSRGQTSANTNFYQSAVQRGDPEMENKMVRVIRTCIEMANNPILSIHDQGAGGTANVTKEIVEPLGATIDIRKVVSGDNTLSVRELWVAEYQEQVTCLVAAEDLETILAIGKRENVPVVSIGQIENTGNIVVMDGETVAVDLPLDKVLNDIPQKTYQLKQKDNSTSNDQYQSEHFKVDNLLEMLKRVDVGSKRFLTNKVDRSVTGLIAQQQCVGPYGTPLANVAVIAQGYDGLTGCATAIGEQPIKGLVNPSAGARMAVGEMLTNMMWVHITKLSDIKCSGNWMWPANSPENRYQMYEACSAMCTLMTELGISIDGGKDSLSMSTVTKKGKRVDCPGQLVISGYAPVPDITKKVTPDFKGAGNGLVFINLAPGKERMGGSQWLLNKGTIGDKSPDVDDSSLLIEVFNGIQQCLRKGYILSGHDRSDGGLITTLIEMAIGGGYGFQIQTNTCAPLEYLLNEELGVVVEVESKYLTKVINMLPTAQMIGLTSKDKHVSVNINGHSMINTPLVDFWKAWETTSHQLEYKQANIKSVHNEWNRLFTRNKPVYTQVNVTVPEVNKIKPKMGVLRDEGSNGDREMAAAFYQAGFEVHDICMNDLLTAEENPLTQYRGLAFVGGFSYSDVFGAAKGWYSVILSNPHIKQWFDEFYEREDTFSFGICNGCQLMSLLGWIPECKLVKNDSGRFESRYSTVKIGETKSLMLKGMEGWTLGVWSAHGEGKIVTDKISGPLYYVDDNRYATTQYPDNPNGSSNGLAGLVSENGRHLAMMPHPERSFLSWQQPYGQTEGKYSPWMRMFVNALEFCR